VPGHRTLAGRSRPYWLEATTFFRMSSRVLGIHGRCLMMTRSVGPHPVSRGVSSSRGEMQQQDRQTPPPRPCLNPKAGCFFGRSRSTLANAQHLHTTYPSPGPSLARRPAKNPGTPLHRYRPGRGHARDRNRQFDMTRTIERRTVVLTELEREASRLGGEAAKPLGRHLHTHSRQQSVLRVEDRLRYGKLESRNSPNTPPSDLLSCTLRYTMKLPQGSEGQESSYHIITSIRRSTRAAQDQRCVCPIAYMHHKSCNDLEGTDHQ
jgi:hypothetical protein